MTFSFCTGRDCFHIVSFPKVCVPKRRRDKILEKPLQYGTVAGWGSTRPIRLGEPTGPLSAKLRQVTVPIVPDKECKEATVYSYRKEDTLCAGFKRKPKDPCFGDIGSPLVVQNPRSGRWIVIGLFGWSEGCGKPKKYAYYTRVSKYRKWINSIVKQHQWFKKCNWLEWWIHHLIRIGLFYL